MNSLKKQTTGSLIPEDIGGMSLNDLLLRKDVEVHKKDNSLKLKRRTKTEVLTVEVKVYPDTISVCQAKTQLDKPFNQMGETIIQMRKAGKSQREIADILGTTQSHISKIERAERLKNEEE